MDATLNLSYRRDKAKSRGDINTPSIDVVNFKFPQFNDGHFLLNGFIFHVDEKNRVSCFCKHHEDLCRYGGNVHS